MGCTHGPTPRWHCERGPKASPWRRCPRLAPWPCWGPAIVGRPQDHPWGRAKGGLWMVAFGWPPEVALRPPTTGWPLGHLRGLARGWLWMGGRWATPLQWPKGGPEWVAVGLPPGVAPRWPALGCPWPNPWATMGAPPTAPRRTAPRRTASHRTATAKTSRTTRQNGLACDLKRQKSAARSWRVGGGSGCATLLARLVRQAHCQHYHTWGWVGGQEPCTMPSQCPHLS